MPRFSCILAGCAIITLVQATSYKLQDDYTDNFFDKFDFFTGPDPTLGYTDYLTYDNATDCGLIQSTSPPKWGVDNNNVLEPTNTAGRPSVRLTSKNLYNHGLFVLDLAHMPSSACGVWPAFWTFGQTATWPISGEIDIIEYVNSHNTNLMTLHTADGCSIAGDESLMTGSLESNVCDVSQGNGCSIDDKDTNSAGTGFNNGDGGVYAMEWTSDAIQVWFFPSGSVPDAVKGDSPDTADFGKPIARFAGSCDIDSHFYDHAIIFDLTFCGSWAGETFQADGCPMQGSQDSWGSCVTYVAENPNAFDDSYWEVNSLKVYQINASSASASVSAGSSATPAASTTSLALETQSIALGASTTPAEYTTSAVGTSEGQATSTAATRPHNWHHGPPSHKGRRYAHGHQGLDW